MHKAKIYKPAKNTMQSGRARGKKWVLEYKDDAARSPDTLMGWTSAEGTLSQIRLRFDCLEDAISYAEARQIAYSVMPSHERAIKPRNYGDNFKYQPPVTPEKSTSKK